MYDSIPGEHKTKHCTQGSDVMSV